MKRFGDEPAPVIGFIVRFVCGAVVGVLVAAGAGWLEWTPTPRWAMVLMAVFAVLFGLMAAYWREDFWEYAGDIFSWWWWF
jgi:hypothetical protein